MAKLAKLKKFRWSVVAGCLLSLASDTQLGDWREWEEGVRSLSIRNLENEIPENNAQGFIPAFEKAVSKLGIAELYKKMVNHSITRIEENDRADSEANGLVAGGKILRGGFLSASADYTVNQQQAIQRTVEEPVIEQAIEQAVEDSEEELERASARISKRSRGFPVVNGS